MSIPKLCGLETEYAIVGGGPGRAAADLVRAYPHISLDPTPAEPLLRDDVRQTHSGDLVRGDLMLGNGARFYVDHAHPEYSTPESVDPCAAVALDRAGAEILRRCAEVVNQNHPKRDPVRLYKNNTDHCGNTYGCHENYLVKSSTYEAMLGNKQHWLYAYLVPFLVSRLVFTGAGKVGAEHGSEAVEYQLSQRADFVERVVGLQTTYQRPIVNTRDEPHADPTRFRRLHVIVGDANMCPYAAWLKLGTMQLLLRMLEDGALSGNLYLADPVAAIGQISRDPSCTLPVRLEDGRDWTAVQIQTAFLEQAQRYAAQNRLGESELDVIEGWEQTLLALKDDLASLVGKLDWVTKREILTALGDSEGWDWASPQAHEADIKYHALDPSESVFSYVEQMDLVALPPGWDPSAEERYLREPPADTRAYLRGHCIARFASHTRRVDWEVVSFREGELSLPDPLAANRAAVEEILLKTKTPRRLLKTLRDLPNSNQGDKTTGVSAGGTT